MLARPGVFLDRDGVIIENRSDYVKAMSEVEFLPGALAALRLLQDRDIAVVIVTNQSAVGRGILSLEQAWRIQRAVVAEIEAAGGGVTASYLCPHAPDAGCGCRKPAPGLLLQAANELAIDPARSVMVGDALSDMAAAARAGAAGILVRTGRGGSQAAMPTGLSFHTVADLAAAVDLILSRM